MGRHLGERPVELPQTGLQRPPVECSPIQRAHQRADLSLGLFHKLSGSPDPTNGLHPAQWQLSSRCHDGLPSLFIVPTGNGSPASTDTLLPKYHPEQDAGPNCGAAIHAARQPQREVCATALWRKVQTPLECLELRLTADGIEHPVDLEGCQARPVLALRLGEPSHRSS